MTDYPGGEVAIVGVACRVPGAADLESLWRKVCGGEETLRRFDASPGRVPVFGYLEGIEDFDAAFFGIEPGTARIMDPQHRLFLQICWQALEDAGYDTSRYSGQVAVFAGVAASRYLIKHLLENPEVDDGGDPATTLWSLNSPDHLPARVAYHLGLTGPAVAVQTACSSSLVAVCQAAQSLNDFRCDLALAGGSAIVSTVDGGYVHREGSLTSPDGRNRPLDDTANGSVFGNGTAAVVLKRLPDALADGDHVYAVLRGWAVCNDGPARAGYVTPGMDGQAAVVVEAVQAAEIGAQTIGYAELHAAGTRLGDAVELAAMTRAFRVDTDSRGFCGVGTVKATVGNLDAAAGVVGLIKAAQAVRAGVIPVATGVEVPNAEVDWAGSPFHLPKTTDEWHSEGPRRAIVNSFGLGGTNACVVLEQPPTVASPSSEGAHALRLSARTPSALTVMKARLHEHLLGHPELALADVAFTLREGRRVLAHQWSQGESTAQGRRVSLPGYPFEGERHWVEPR